MHASATAVPRALAMCGVHVTVHRLHAVARRLKDLSGTCSETLKPFYECMDYYR